MALSIDPQFCPHGGVEGYCKECYVDGIQTKKQAKSRVPIKKLKNRSRDQELMIAKGYQKSGFPRAKRQAMSGALAILPGDVDPGDLLMVEAKLTRAGQLVIKSEWLAQIQRQAREMGRAGFYALHAWIAKGSEHYNKVVILDEELFFTVLGWYRENEDTASEV